MAFRRRAPEPHWHEKRRLEEKAAKEDAANQSTVSTLFGFTEEEVELMRKCICPKRGCTVHPGENLEHLVDKPTRRR